MYERHSPFIRPHDEPIDAQLIAIQFNSIAYLQDLGVEVAQKDLPKKLFYYEIGINEFVDIYFKFTGLDDLYSPSYAKVLF